MTKPLQDGWGVWNVVMRGRAGFLCKVPVSVEVAFSQARARELAEEMFPELVLDAGEIEPPEAAKEKGRR